MTITDLPTPVLGPRPEGGEHGAEPHQLVRSLSPSRASDFMACPLRYRFRTIDRLPEQPSSAAVRGTLVHAVLERLFDLPPVERTPVSAAGLLEPEWRRLLEAAPELAAVVQSGEGDGGPEGKDHLDGSVRPPADTAHTADTGDTGDGDTAVVRWLASARVLLHSYFALEDPTRLRPAAREERVEVVLDNGLQLRGYVDRIDEAPDGRLRVVDYKTGRAPGERFEARALFQMKFYALVLWRTRGRIPRELRLIYLADRELVRYAPDERELLGFERTLRALWQAIERAVVSGDWRASRSRLCDWCDHQSLCPEFGGTPPPLPTPPVLVDAPPPGAGRGEAAPGRSH